MTTKKKPRSILVLGRRWFERTNGNTYHTARVLVDGVEVATVPYQYGYGSQYEQNALDALEALGLMPGREHYKNGGSEGWQYFKRNGIQYSAEAVDVERKRDL